MFSNISSDCVLQQELTPSVPREKFVSSIADACSSDLMPYQKRANAKALDIKMIKSIQLLPNTHILARQQWGLLLISSSLRTRDGLQMNHELGTTGGKHQPQGIRKEVGSGL